METLRIPLTYCIGKFAIMPDNFIFIAFYFVLPKRKMAVFSKPKCLLTGVCAVFLNSLLATLNARRTIRETSTGLVSIPFSKTASFGNMRHGDFSSSREDQVRLYAFVNPSWYLTSVQGVEIQIHTTTDTKTDNLPHIPEVRLWLIADASTTSWCAKIGWSMGDCPSTYVGFVWRCSVENFHVLLVRKIFLVQH